MRRRLSGQRDRLIEAIIAAESGGNPRAVNPRTGAAGLMQVMPDTARDPGFGVQPLPWDQRFDPAANRRFGTSYFDAMMARYGDDVPKALAAYNWGPGNADKWSGDMAALPDETAAYVKRIQASAGLGRPSPPESQPTAPPHPPRPAKASAGLASKVPAGLSSEQEKQLRRRRMGARMAGLPEPGARDIVTLKPGDPTPEGMMRIGNRAIDKSYAGSAMLGLAQQFLQPAAQPAEPIQVIQF